MRDWQSPSHVRWYCKYHIVFVPKYRRRVISGQLRRSSGRIIRELYQQQSVERVEGHAMPAHVPLCLSSPPTFSVANTVGWLTGKSAIHFREGCEAGAHQGTQIARFVVRHELRPLKGK